MKLPKIDTLIKKHLKAYRYENTRTEVLNDMIEVDGYIYCQHCQRSSGFHKIHVHHIMFRSEQPKHPNLHNKLNLLVLCSDCHPKFHADKSIRNKYIIERNLKELFK